LIDEQPKERKTMSRFVKTSVLAVLCACALGACSKRSEQPPAPAEPKPAETAAAPDPAEEEALMARADAKQLFTTRCSVCHGAKGKGDGPGSAALNPKPRDYTNAAWQKSVTDDQLRAVITMGGAAIGKSPVMPSSPDLQAKPKVVDELVKIVRAFGNT
jgi:mono/diheme cytochrome c family protein